MQNHIYERIIGIRHRVKQTKAGEARPTELFMKYVDGSTQTLELETERDELDFVQGICPISWRFITPEDDIKTFQSHHIKWKKVSADEIPENFPKSFIREGKKEIHIAHKVPVAYDGLRENDTVVMLMGGSGDRFAFALSRQAELYQQTKVCRLPSFLLKKLGCDTKDSQSSFLTQLYTEQTDLFRETSIRDRSLILLREAFRARIDAMKARIVVEQQLFQSFLGRIFCSEEGRYPEGSIEVMFDALKATDEILVAMRAVEQKREKELVRILETIPIYKKVFVPIEGCGPLIAARLIATIGDIRQFESKAKLKAYCGVHVLPDGRMARKRSGEVANWASEARQALFLLGDQFNRRPNSVWGQKLREYKGILREKHPQPIEVSSKISEIFRSIERYFLSLNICLDQTSFDLKTWDGLYEYFRAGRSEILMDEWGEATDDAFDLLSEDHRSRLFAFEEIINACGGGHDVKKSITLYSPGHIHKMAMWRTLTKFTEKLYSEWKKVDREVRNENEVLQKAA